MNLTKFAKVPTNVGGSTDSNVIPIYGIIWETNNRILVYKPNDMKHPWKEIEDAHNSIEPTINNMIFAGQYNGPTIGYKDLDNDKTILGPNIYCSRINGGGTVIGDSDTEDHLLTFLGLHDGIIIGIQLLSDHNNRVFSFNINIIETDKGIIEGDNYTETQI